MEGRNTDSFKKNENALMNNVQSQEDLANLAVMNLTGQDTGLRTEVEILKVHQS